jgi:hypothetical protein
MIILLKIFLSESVDSTRHFQCRDDEFNFDIDEIYSYINDAKMFLNNYYINKI